MSFCDAEEFKILQFILCRHLSILVRSKFLNSGAFERNVELVCCTARLQRVAAKTWCLT